MKKTSEHAVYVWNKFVNRSKGDYHYLHLKTDILLVANAFKELKIYFKYNQLDQCYYFKRPGIKLHLKTKVL